MPLCALARQSALTAGMVTMMHGEPTGKSRRNNHAIELTVHWLHRTLLYWEDLRANNSR